MFTVWFVKATHSPVQVGRYDRPGQADEYDHLDRAISRAGDVFEVYQQLEKAGLAKVAIQIQVRKDEQILYRAGPI